jgi:hypothetical protein
LPKALQNLVVVAIERDFDDHRFRQTELLLVEKRDVAVDVTLCFKPLEPVPAWCGGQPNLVRELCCGEAGILLQRAQDAPIYLIQPLGVLSASCRRRGLPDWTQ